MPPGINLLKDNLVVRVMISLIGVFVFFFVIFVCTYIYFKCFRKTTIHAGGRVRENEWQVQYKSLSFDAVEPQIPLHPEPQECVNTDFTYLTPVFSPSETRESRHICENEIRNENEILPGTRLNEYRVNSLETTSKEYEPNIIHDDVQHDYSEITEKKTESSNSDADPEIKNKTI